MSSERIRRRMAVVEELRLAKEGRTYTELSRLLGVPTCMVCRYIDGQVLPRYKTALEFHKKLKPLLPSLYDEIRPDEHGYVDTGRIMANTRMLKQVAREVLLEFRDERITKVLTAEGDGTPLATLIASEFDRDLVIATRNPRMPSLDYYRESWIEDDTVLRTLYLPRGYLSRRDDVLIVDLLMRSGCIQQLLINLVSKAGAMPAALYSLIAVGDDYKKRIALPKHKVRIGYKIHK